MVHNSRGGMLDLVLSDFNSEQLSVSEGDEPLVPIDDYHPSLEITIICRNRAEPSPSPSPPLQRPGSSPNWNWRKADFLGLYVAINNLDWSDMSTMNDINGVVELFYGRLYDCISQYVPTKSTFEQDHKYVYPIWFNAEIISNIRKKYYHLKRYRAEGKIYNRELFKFYRWHVKNLIDNAYKQHLQLTEQNLINDPTRFWEYIKYRNSVRQRTNVYRVGDVEVVEQAAANAFADYFCSVYVNEAPSLDPDIAMHATVHQRDATSISVNTVDVSNLKEAVKRLKPRSSGGPDGIPVFLAKDCISAFVRPLIYIYNLALSTCRYPEVWKISRVTPVPKANSDNDVSSYRPIAVISVFAKIFESVLCQQINKQIGNLLHDSQHGFRQACSTTTNLVAHVDYIYAELDSGKQVDTAYFDFKKAFDLVHNDILLHKLVLMGFSSQLVKFFSNYLRDRRQFVKIGNFTSSDYYVRSGVSQGSTLGPLLFLIFINDLPHNVITAKCLLFADDLKLSLGVDGLSDCHALQRDIDAVMNWSVLNLLPFNVNKCKIITFSRKRCPLYATYTLSDAPLVRVSEIRDLGLILDTSLNFHNHVTAVCKKASKMLGFVIRTSSQFGRSEVALVLYNAYILSKLEYGAIVWDPYEEKYILMVERIQRKFTRWLYKRKYGYYPYLYPSLFVTGMTGLNTLKLRRAMQMVVHYLSIIHNKMYNPTIMSKVGLLVPNRVSWNEEGLVAPRRPPRLLSCPLARTRYAAHAPTNRSLRLISDMLAHDWDIDLFFDSFAKLCNSALFYLNNST
jgi:hypothetical protein